jgi:hypothetical protein
MKDLTEKRLFDIIKKYIPDLTETDEYNFSDAYSLSRNARYEFKCRRTHYDNLLIEKIKWDKLIKCDNVKYINSTPNGVYSFDLKVIKEPYWEEREMPKTTEFENKEKSIKLVGYINISEGKDITLLIKKFL